MFFNIQEKNITVNGIRMNYVAFGNGKIPLIILPGLGDGLKSVRGQSAPLAIFYREFAQKFRVYIFSRKNVLDEGYTTKDMAKDQKGALEKLGIDRFYLMGVSQGGMIAQHLAIDYPDMVEKLVLAVSISKPNDVFYNTISRWVELAKTTDYKNLIIDTCESTYTTKRLKLYRLIYPILSKVGKPKDFDRFLIQAKSCVTHNTYNELQEIKCPTLIAGGENDKIVGKEASEEMAKKISGSKLIIYKEFGHGAYEESKNFNQQVIGFLK